MKLYFHSPLPPARTGIADYSAELIPVLAEKSDLTVVADLETQSEYKASCINIDTAVINFCTDEQRQTDLNRDSIDIYQIGNNRFHTSILERALKRPGVAVIHDVSLTGLLANESSELRNRFLEYELGEAASQYIKARAEYKIFGWQEFTIRNLGLLVDSSRAIIVHSEFAKNLLLRRYRQKNIIKIDHHLAKEFANRSINHIENDEGRNFLENNRGRIKIGTFGFLTPPKRIDWLVDAFKRALEQGADASLLLGGLPHPDTKIELLISGIPKDRVYVTGYLTESDMKSLMSQIDIQVSLRFPSVGESSGTLTRTLGLGVPSVVTDHESFSDFSDQHLTKIPLSKMVANDLAAIVTQFSLDPSDFHKKASAAREYVTKNFSIEASASGYITASKIGVGRTGSKLAEDISKDIINCFPGQLFCSNKAKFNALMSLADSIFEMQSIRQLASIHDCELICAEVSEAYVSINNDVSDMTRRIVIVVMSGETDAKKIEKMIRFMNLKRFDILTFVIVDLHLTHALPSVHRADSLVDQYWAVKNGFQLRASSSPQVCVEYYNKNECSTLIRTAKVLVMESLR